MAHLVTTLLSVMGDACKASADTTPAMMEKALSHPWIISSEKLGERDIERGRKREEGREREREGERQRERGRAS